MSKELEAFRDILGILSAVSGCEVDMNSERVIIIKQALLKIQEQNKLLEIIRYNVIPLVRIKNNCVWDNEGYEYLTLTQEEFNLLKEWLKNES